MSEDVAKNKELYRLIRWGIICLSITLIFSIFIYGMMNRYDIVCSTTTPFKAYKIDHFTGRMYFVYRGRAVRVKSNQSTSTPSNRKSASSATVSPDKQYELIEIGENKFTLMEKAKSEKMDNKKP